MKHSSFTSKSQADIQILDQIDDFFNKFHIGTLLDRCGIRKRHGYSVRSLIITIFALPFIGKNFFRGIVINDNSDVGKDAAYDLLKACTYNWRRFLLIIGTRLHRIFDRLTSDQRESVLIIDDSPYDRSRSKKVELLSRVFDHSTGRYIRGFRLLTVCWSDGVSCLPLDFALLSSAKRTNRFHESKKIMDKRCCAFRRRKEATTKATALLEPMVKRIMNAGVSARYVLMQTDHRSFGDLFYACCQELDDIEFVEALHRIMTLAVEQLRQMGTFCEKTAAVFFDTVMTAALKCVKLSKSSLITNDC